jgi:acetyl esterase
MSLRPVARAERIIARAFLGLPTPVLRTFTGQPRRSPEGYVLDMQTQALLWLMRVRREPPMHSGGLARARRRLDRAGTTLDPKIAAGISSFDRTMPGAEGPRRVRTYVPTDLAGDAAPGLVFFHGGGFCLGSIESHDGICRALATRAKVVVLSVDYRLAPEHPFPAAADDCVAVTRWILDHASDSRLDPGSIAVGGDSAGGNLAAVVSQTLRGAPRSPAFQLLLYPATDATRREASHRHFRDGLMLTKDNIDWFMQSYFPTPESMLDPRGSPLLAKDLSGLPPALVLTAGFDPLRDEGRAYAERMRVAGVPVEYVCSEGSVHGFANTAGVLRESARMLDLAADRLVRALSSKRVVPTAA